MCNVFRVFTTVDFVIPRKSKFFRNYFTSPWNSMEFCERYSPEFGEKRHGIPDKTPVLQRSHTEIWFQGRQILTRKSFCPHQTTLIVTMGGGGWLTGAHGPHLRTDTNITGSVLMSLRRNAGVGLWVRHYIIRIFKLFSWGHLLWTDA
jgi:hypothetical protein